MKKSYVITLVVIIALAIGGTVTALSIQKQNADHDAMMQKDAETAAMKKEEDAKAMKAAEVMKEKEAMMSTSPSPSPSDAMMHESGQ